MDCSIENLWADVIGSNSNSNGDGKLKKSAVFKTDETSDCGW